MRKKGRGDRQILQVQAQRIAHLIELDISDGLLAAEMRLLQTQMGKWFFGTIHRLTEGINQLGDRRK